MDSLELGESLERSKAEQSFIGHRRIVRVTARTDRSLSCRACVSSPSHRAPIPIRGKSEERSPRGFGPCAGSRRPETCRVVGACAVLFRRESRFLGRAWWALLLDCRRSRAGGDPGSAPYVGVSARLIVGGVGASCIWLCITIVSRGDGNCVDSYGRPRRTVDRRGCRPAGPVRDVDHADQDEHRCQDAQAEHHETFGR